MIAVLQQLVDGLGRGSAYALLALGLGLIFGVMHLVNFAHGEPVTVAAYSVYAAAMFGAPWWALAVVAVVAAVLTSLAIEFAGFRRLRAADDFTLLLTSFGIAVLVRAGFSMWVSTTPRQFHRPAWIFDTVRAGPLALEIYDLVVIAVTALTLVGTWLLLQKTMFGLALRAAAEDFDAARLMGARANRLIAGAFALAGLLAGIAAVLILMRRGQAEPDMGLDILLPGLLAAIIGGLGRLEGAVLGGLALGVAQSAFRAWILPNSLSRLTEAAVFGLIALLFIFRPEGILSARRAERV
ncbi:MAG TPA: branched-chain amino acid ABC transporter permease [Acidimicrobiia bacterium]|nr:branched-chain amino acid ABC transporter permease [Acidimicrobiia bacterium]